MKLFENSLIHHLENLVIDNKLSKNQRGFVEESETHMNITEVISFGNDLKAQKIKGLLLFIDLRKAYYWVDRSVLLKKCSRKGLPSNFIDLLCNIFSKQKWLWMEVTIFQRREAFSKDLDYHFFYLIFTSMILLKSLKRNSLLKRILMI